METSDPEWEEYIISGEGHPPPTRLKELRSAIQDLRRTLGAPSIGVLLSWSRYMPDIYDQYIETIWLTTIRDFLMTLEAPLSPEQLAQERAQARAFYDLISRQIKDIHKIVWRDGRPHLSSSTLAMLSWYLYLNGPLHLIEIGRQNHLLHGVQGPYTKESLYYPSRDLIRMNTSVLAQEILLNHQPLWL